jgi:hypothetical protein
VLHQVLVPGNSSLHFLSLILCIVGRFAAARECIRSSASLWTEVLALRHQLTVLQRSNKRPKLSG